ncbi:hypothetical protein [Novipirellula sp.]|uniref:hypothetical protein n=1 Tax=Novipirellula sp. TaxID=2795430 RepID=UPI0035626D9F
MLKEIYCECPSELYQVLFDPIFAMVEVLTGDWVVSHQEAPPNSPSPDVSDRNFVGIEDFRAR